MTGIVTFKRWSPEEDGAFDLELQECSINVLKAVAPVFTLGAPSAIVQSQMLAFLVRCLQHTLISRGFADIGDEQLGGRLRAVVTEADAGKYRGTQLEVQCGAPSVEQQILEDFAPHGPAN